MKTIVILAYIALFNGYANSMKVTHDLNDSNSSKIFFQAHATRKELRELADRVELTEYDIFNLTHGLESTNVQIAFLTSDLSIISSNIYYLEDDVFNLWKTLESNIERVDYDIDSLNSSIAQLEEQCGECGSDTEDIEEKLDELQDKLATLIEEVNSALERLSELENSTEAGSCPSTATDAVVVDDFCYSIEKDIMDYDGAKVECHRKGGWLTDPPLSYDEFHTNLMKAFPMDLEMGELYYVQIKEKDEEFEYEHRHVMVNRSDDRWNDKRLFINETIVAGAIFITGDWKLFEVDSSESHKFICQYYKQ